MWHNLKTDANDLPDHVCAVRVKYRGLQNTTEIKATYYPLLKKFVMRGRAKSENVIAWRPWEGK